MTSPDNRHQDFINLLLPLRHRLAQYARGVSASREEADDLVGDTILAALEGFDRIRDRSAFRGFLFTVASRLHRRRRWRRKLFTGWDEEHASTLADHGTRPDTAAEVVLLHRALERLPVLQREAVVLFEITGLSLEEIRQIQGGSISAVKSRVSRGRQQLIELLDARDNRDPVPATAETSRTVLTYSSTNSDGYDTASA